jgi:hypothetical protein
LLTLFIIIGYVSLFCSPIVVLVVDSNKRVDIGAVKAEINEKLGGVDIGRDTLFTFVQNPRSFFDFAL